ncbi:hypothetical protein PGT21_031287 [Puccinia graminis f. sp. tritici]|uniref:Uncharacterized protein n=1 Tax=Puccinia graminis f. sp. tritici TaxID=56615 RepID=A0A5B0Q870_PUCGR|nr:hypothetical protein PGT21_031287 [Puccinia graminis f. sp. tritici]KAA1109272.1 hypothetical protein PGTUg99_025093 [Puccinia graminis f. sp. tritici]
MPPRQKKNPAAASQPDKAPGSTPAATQNSTQVPSSRSRKTPVSWEKDGFDGFSSMRLLMDWLTTPGNFVRWRGDKQKGLNKEALAGEIVLILVEHGIHHRNNKDIRTKIQEIQDSYSKACDWLRNTGQGVLDSDIAEGTDNVRAALLKRCKYYYDLDEFMGSRTCTNPEDTVNTSGQLVPDLLNPPTTSDTEDDEQPVGPHATPARPSNIDAPPSHDSLALEPRSPSSNTARVKSNAKGKEKKKNRGLPDGIEKAIDDSTEFRIKSLQSKERRDDKKLAAEKARDRKRIKIEQRRLRIEESDAQVRRVQAETEQVRQRTSIMIDLKKAGFADDDIKTFLDGQFKTNAFAPSDLESTDSESALDDELV